MKKNWKISSRLNGKLVEEFFEVRGFSESEKDLFISPVHPREIPNKINWQIEDAKKLIEESIKNGFEIFIHGDYDVDGVSATAIIYKTIKNHLNYQNCRYFIPDRFEDGYGLSKESVDKINALAEDAKNKLLITVDCGITAFDSCEYAKEKGFKVLISDHHQKPEKLPEPDVLLWSDELTGAGIAFALSTSLIGAKKDLIVLALLGTIADLQPLLRLNRSIVKYGLKVFPESKVLGLNKLMEAAGLKPGELSTYDVGWVISPRLNAAGRLESAINSLKLLTSESEYEVTELANYLNQINADRQKKTFDSFKDAKEKASNEKKIIFVEGDYHEGVIGLVAGRLAQEYYLPAVVLSRGDEESKGSCRSIEGVNIIEILRKKVEIFENVGGHPMAAGFTIKNSKIADLKEHLESESLNIEPNLLVPVLKIDFEIDASLIELETLEEIKKLEPFGTGNPEPVFAMTGRKAFDVKTVGSEGKHLKFKVEGLSPHKPIDAIYFNGGERMQELIGKEKVDLAFNIKENNFNGRTTVNLHIKDFR